MEENLDKKITDRLRSEILNSTKSKSQIANEIGISRPTLSQYLSGRCQPTLATFTKLCICLDVSADDILGLN